MLRKKHLKEREQVTSLLLDKISKKRNPSTNTRRILLSISVLLDVETKYPLEQPEIFIDLGR